MKRKIKIANEIKVNVKDIYGNIIARVKYNSNLDYWAGRNYTNGGTGQHKGPTKHKD